MQFWCSAQGRAWDWTWRPYVGVWVLVGLVVAWYVRLLGRTPAGPARRARAVSFGVGTVALWAALDWPLGTLGAGYLASVHMIQFLLVALVAPPLLLLGIPPAAWSALARRRRAVAALGVLAHPVVAILAFNAIIGFTHWPAIVDGLMASQIGSFALDMLWILGGILFWWPVVSPVPEWPWFGDPLKIGYLILATILMSGPFLYLTFSRMPVYSTYELAPPIRGIGKAADQQAAGVIMKVGGGVILWAAIAGLFWHWWAVEGEG